MKPEDVTNELNKARFRHLDENELEAYLELQLDEIGSARVEAHLKLCLLCEQQLMLLKEENFALANQQISVEDTVLVRDTLKKLGLKSSVRSDVGAFSPLTDRLNIYLQEMVAGWREYFRQLQSVSFRDNSGTEIWSWQSDDKVFQIHVVLEDNADLTIHIGSGNLDMEGVRIRYRLGPISDEITMSRSSESEIAAKIIIPKRQRPQDLSDISIEII